MSPPEAVSDSCNRRFLHLPCSGVAVAHVKCNQPSGKVPLNLLFGDSTNSTATAHTAHFQICFIFWDQHFRALLLHKQNSAFNFFSLNFIQFSDSRVPFTLTLCHLNETRVICCPLSWQSSIFPGELQGHQSVYLMNIYTEICLERKKIPWGFSVQWKIVCWTSWSMHLQVHAEKDKVEIFTAKESVAGVRLCSSEGIFVNYCALQP